MQLLMVSCYLLIVGSILHTSVYSFDISFKDQCYDIPRRCYNGLLGNEFHKECIDQRKQEVLNARNWYQITVEGKHQTIIFPLTFVPFLNQTIKDIKEHYAIDSDESRYLLLLSVWEKKVQTIGEEIKSKFSNVKLNSVKDYTIIYKSFDEAVKKLNVPQYFDNPTLHANFTDENMWSTDEAFVQRRLAGMCPYFLRKVTYMDYIGMSVESLLKIINQKALSLVTYTVNIGNQEITLLQAIKSERLFVLYHEDLDKIQVEPGVDNHDGRRLHEPISPITLFVLNGDGILDVVAIQLNSKPDSKVYTPKSPTDEWTNAKAQVEIADVNICQAKFHLGSIHFGYSIFCLAYRRHFSKQNPLFDLFKYHCEGTIPHISTAYSIMMIPDSFSFGYKELIKLSSKGYRDRYYGDLDYRSLINDRGLDDERIKYYPFRDDSKLILAELETFAESFVNRYYENWRGMDMISYDVELQSFANEISADGNIQPDAGKGRFIGFPSKFTENNQLKQFIVRFLWYNIIHVTTNYAILPNFITVKRIQKKKNRNDYTYDEYLPNIETALKQIKFQTMLGSFRANRLMDYYEKPKYESFRELVRKTYGRLNTCVQETLQQRNKDRQDNGRLGYQFLEPKWIPNSIHV